MTDKQAARLTELLQRQLSTYNDLHPTLKHIHWNVVGPNFIGVHEIINPQVEAVRAFADDVAERIAALGASPEGTPGAVVRDRVWDDYAIGRDTVQAHLAALDLVYNGGARRSNLGRLLGDFPKRAFGLGGPAVQPLGFVDGDVGARHQQ